jgi:hypothetical protein
LGWGSIVSRPPVVVLQKSFSRVLLSIDYVQYILSTPPYHIFQIYQNVHKGVKKKGAIQTKTIKTWLWKIKVTGLKHTMCPCSTYVHRGATIWFEIPPFVAEPRLLELNWKLRFFYMIGLESKLTGSREQSLRRWCHMQTTGRWGWTQSSRFSLTNYLF